MLRTDTHTYIYYTGMKIIWVRKDSLSRDSVSVSLLYEIFIPVCLFYFNIQTNYIQLV